MTKTATDDFRLPSEEPLPPRIDIRIATFFLLLGSAIAAISLKMPTYFEQKGEIYTAPGLVPGIYGLVIAGLSIWLGLRALGRRRAGIAGVPPKATTTAEYLQLAAAAFLCIFYAAGLIGRTPFWLATTIFVTAFIVLFEWQPGLAPRERLRLLATALIQGIVTGLLVTLVFEKIFLVRLP